ncbi:hypothetical protein BDN72DRAFT_855525 [Pluteus cervinus]|uniref:Uncharacterized protein n=1 Tax=Pluteus cervinus TaxID=181527 RepID=A0ACD3B2U3_9AGAR|nr:hypothetical protein BDN72DRAFT_855525 [Pluteus cervinus]
MTLWEWLYKFIRCPIPWIDKLHRNISVYLLNTSEDHVLDPKDYIPDLDTVSTTIYTIPARRSTLNPIDAAAIEDKMVDALSVWLNFPTRADWESKSWFIRDIVNNIGSEGLVLPSVIWATTRLNDYVLERGRTCKLTRKNIQDWTAIQLSHHPITRSTTLERQCLERMVSHVRSYYPDWTCLLTCSDSHLRDDLSVLDLTTMINIMEPLAIDPDQHITIPHCSAKGYALRQFLSDVQYDDKKNIFRDLAPSRRHILKDAGPFSPLHLHTQAGFFSALLHRGITHHTEFLLEHKTVFTSEQLWNSTIQSKTSKPPKYFCDPCAYGQPAKDRKVTNAGAYWTFSINKPLTNWLLYSDNQKIGFLDLYNKIRKAHIPAFGALTTYLLTVDYAIAGVVALPEPMEMGQILFEINAGGIDGLRRLGFPCRTVEETGDAFAFVMSKLQETMSPEREDRMDFGIFMVEHTLCKLKRMGQKSYYEAAEEEWYQGIRL